MPQKSQESPEEAAFAAHTSSCPCHRQEKAVFDHGHTGYDHTGHEPRESEAAAFVAALAAADQHRRNIRRPSSSEEEEAHQRHLHLHLHLQRAGRC